MESLIFWWVSLVALIGLVISAAFGIVFFVVDAFREAHRVISRARKDVARGQAASNDDVRV